jgi:hypothetical protein
MSEVVLIYPRKEYSKPLSRKDQRNAKKRAKSPAEQSRLHDETQEAMEQLSSFLYSSGTGMSDLEEALLRLQRMNIEVTCIEPVLNRTLWKRFESKVAELKGKPSLTSDCKIRVAFHGTEETNITKIVKDGFLVPGSRPEGAGAIHRSQRGATWGLGIYSSPRVETALNYGPQRILMCAVILGSIHRCSKMCPYQPPKSGSDSHMSPNSAEWVLFDSSQIVPLCVLHVRSFPRRAVNKSEKEYDELLSRERARIMNEEGLERLSNPKHFKYQAYR